MKTQQADFGIINCGSIFLFMPASDAARHWLDEHCPAGDDHQYMGPDLVVEHRYIGDLVDLAVQDGLQPPSRI